MKSKLESTQIIPPLTRPLFTKRKFLSFPIIQQHKKCSELLKEAYLFSSQRFLDHYNDIQNWMGEYGIENLNTEEVSNRYHRHLQMSEQSVSEHDLLPNIRQSDKSFPLCKPLPLTVYLDRIRSAHNVGSILRTVEAFSLGEVCFSQETPFIDHTQVQKTSMGSYRYVKCTKVANISDLPKPLILLETCENAVPLKTFHFPKKFTLVVGNEEHGCSQELLKAADNIVKIPLRGRKNSLNVANAFAIAAAEIVEQIENKNKDQYGN